MLLPDLLREVGLHVPQRLGPPKPSFGVEASSLRVSRHHIGVHVWCRLVPVDAGVNHVFRPMTLLQPL